jgi:hypothetical protein
MDSGAGQTTLPADICVTHFRALRLDVSRRLAVAALPLWYQVASQKPPDPGPRRGPAGDAGWRWSTSVLDLRAGRPSAGAYSV